MELIAVLWGYVGFMLGFLIYRGAEWVLDRRSKKRELDEHETHPGATAPGLPHQRRKK